MEMFSMKELDEFEYFEALDRTHIASTNLQYALGEHPVWKAHPEAQKIYDQAVELLEELYQLIPNLTPDDGQEW